MDSTQRLHRTRVIQINLENDIVGRNTPLPSTKAGTMRNNLNTNTRREHSESNYENKYSKPFFNSVPNISLQNNSFTNANILKDKNTLPLNSNAAGKVPNVKIDMNCGSNRDIKDLCEEVLQKSRKFTSVKTLSITSPRAEILSPSAKSTRAIGRIRKQQPKGKISLESPKSKGNSQKTFFPNFSPIVPLDQLVSPKSKVNDSETEIMIMEERGSIVEKAKWKGNLCLTPLTPKANLEEIPKDSHTKKIVVDSFELKFWKLDFEGNVESIGPEDCHGKVKVVYSNGFIYYGNWNGNTMNGFGELTNPEGKLIYCGEWKNGRIHGFGRLLNPLSNSQLTSNFLSFDHSNLFSLSSKWKQLEGRFQEGIAEGKCKLTLVNGDQFESVFTEGKANGKSLWRFSDSKSKETHCIFSNNRLILNLGKK